MKSQEEILIELQQQLKPGRYRHTLGVAFTAASLAMSYGVKEQCPFLYAGLLHDCAKGMNKEALYEYCEKNQILLTEIEYENESLVHAKAGAYLAKKKYGVKDEEILSAIRFHTTGRPKMSFLEKCIFASDYIEPYREHPANPSLTEIRKIIYNNIDLAVYYILDNTVRYLSTTNERIDPMTEETFEYYKKLLYK